MRCFVLLYCPVCGRVGPYVEMPNESCYKNEEAIYADDYVVRPHFSIICGFAIMAGEEPGCGWEGDVPVRCPVFYGKLCPIV